METTPDQPDTRKSRRIALSAGLILLLLIGGVVVRAGWEVVHGRLPLADVPVYPGARLDWQTTNPTGQAMHYVTSRFGSRQRDRAFSARYDVPASPAAILAWYDRRMAAAGWTGGPACFDPVVPGANSHFYMRKKVTLIVYSEPAARSGSRMDLTLCNY